MRITSSWQSRCLNPHPDFLFCSNDSPSLSRTFPFADSEQSPAQKKHPIFAQTADGACTNMG